ncbi:hypothetical protein MHU86_2230 [Fragilaria crotonensis]|nr:hypothetical protein MHU86_2230 [Fragilaria crotonensis]
MSSSPTMTMMEGGMKISPRRRLLLQSLIVVEMILLTASAFRWGLCTTRAADNDDTYDNSKWCPSFHVSQHQVVDQLLKQNLVTFHDGDDDTEKATSGSRTRLQRYRLNLVLQLEVRSLLPPSQQQQMQHQTLYQQWSSAWNEWMEQTSFSKWPFWKETPTSTIILGGTLTKISKTKQSQSQENVETRLVATSLVEELFQSYVHRLEDDELEVILYVYTQQPSQSSRLLFTDENTGKESEALVIHQNRLIILQGPNTNTIGDSMSYLIPFLSKITLAHDNHDDDGGSIMTNSTQIEAWQQRVVKSYLHELRLELLSTRDWLFQLSTKDNIHVPAPVGEQWMQAFTSRNRAMHLYQQRRAVEATEQKQQWREILELLEQAQLQLSNIRTDPVLMPPLHFQMDHTLAIFAPLLFPLLLPMIVGLRREYKRYKTGTFP